MASSEDPCCAAGTLVYFDNTVPEKGTVHTLTGINCYIAGTPRAGGTTLIIGTDIFGQTQNMRRNADMLAEAMKCTVCIPDHFRGASASDQRGGPATIAFRQV